MNAEATSTQLTIDHDTQQPVETKTTTALTLVSKSIAEINAVEATITALESKYRNVIFQVQTSDGMKEACKARADIRAPRYALQNMQKAAKAPLNELKRSIDEQTDEFITRIEAIEDPIHLQITNEETRKEEEKKAKAEAERKRVAALHDRIEEIRQNAADAVGEDSATIHQRIRALTALPVDDTFAELKQQAEGAKETTLIRLRTMHGKAVAHEEQQQQLAAERERLAREREVEERWQAEQRAELGRQRAAEEIEMARWRAEAEERAAAERARIAEEERQARLAREAEERRQAEANQLAEMRLQEIQGIQHQVFIATTGRLGVRKGGTRQCIVETLVGTEAWEISEQKFGPLLPMAREAKISAISQIKELLDRWDRRVAEEERLAAERQRQKEEADRLEIQRLEAERQETARRETLEAEERRIADERAQLEREREEQRMREAGGGAPVGATASESGDSNIAKAATEPEMESTASSSPGPGPTSPQGFVDIVFDGPPEATTGRFVEVEDASGKSISIGEWIHRADGFWVLRANFAELGVIPAAWMRRAVSPGGPHGPPEVDYECYAGDEPPDDGNTDWIPLYRKVSA